VSIVEDDGDRRQHRPGPLVRRRFTLLNLAAAAKIGSETVESLSV
jgi:hypothetical protein